MAEMPALIQMAKEYGDSVQFLGMFTTPELKNAKIVDAQLHFPYPILDGSKLLDTYHANSWPTLIVIDQQQDSATRACRRIGRPAHRTRAADRSISDSEIARSACAFHVAGPFAEIF